MTMKVNVSRYLMGDFSKGDDPFSLMEVEVDRVKLNDRNDDQQRTYMVRIKNPPTSAPTSKNAEGELWIRVKKKENKGVKIPTLSTKNPVTHEV